MGTSVTRRTLLLGAASTGLVGCGPGDPTLAAQRVLFLGNSVTARNGGLDGLLHDFAPRAETARVAPDGCTLTRHLEEPDTLEALAAPDGWDVVVLQEQTQTPVYAYSSFAAALRRLADLARGAGATPVALATWGRPDSPGVTTAALSRAYATAAAAAAARTCAAGAAFARARSLRRDLVLAQADGHPTAEGSYLAALVVLRTVYGPVGPNGVTAGLDDDVATFLQGVAAGG